MNNPSIITAAISAAGVIMAAFITKLPINKIDSTIIASIILSIAILIGIMIAKFM